MPDSPQTESNPQNAQANNNNVPPSYLRWIVIYSITAFVLLLGVSYFWPNLTERTKFFTSNALVLALLIVAIAQVLIYYGQQQIMQGQLGVMQGSLKAMQAQMRPYIGVESVKLNALKNNTREVIIEVTLVNEGNTPATDLTLTQPEIVIDRWPRNHSYETTTVHWSAIKTILPHRSQSMTIYVGFKPAERDVNPIELDKNELWVTIYSKVLYVGLGEQYDLEVNQVYIRGQGFVDTESWESHTSEPA